MNRESSEINHESSNSKNGTWARCIGCGCTDSMACVGGCHWLAVDYNAGRGVCSECEVLLQQFHVDELRAVVASCKFGAYTFAVQEGHGGIHLQASYVDRDIVTGKPETQFTRKWLLSPAMTRSEVVQTCFKLVMTSMEHRAREGFTYRGKRVFGPHFDVEALWQICADRRYDARPRDGGQS